MAEKSTFTPGPWEVGSFYGKHDSELHLAVGTETYPRYPIACVSHFDHATPTDSANARLIAAAPDLYRMLQTANTRLNELCEIVGCRNGLNEEIVALLAKARGAQ